MNFFWEILFEQQCVIVNAFLNQGEFAARC